MFQVDFQFSCERCPALDLFFFLTYSLKEDARVAEFNKMLEFYFHELDSSLQRLQCQHSHSLSEQVGKRRFSCAFYLVFHLMVLLLDHNLDMELALRRDENGRDYRKRLYSTPKYVSTAQKFIKFLSKTNSLTPPKT